MPGASVKSLDRVEEFRLGMVNTLEICNKALDEIQFEARRFVDWIEHEQRRYWEQMIRKSMEEIAEAKNALNRKRLSKTDGRPVDTIEEEKALRLAKFRNETAIEKLELVKKFSRKVMEAYQEYEGQARNLGDLVEGKPAPPLAALDRIIEALKAYLEVTAPAVERLPPAS
jgi:hypothetical protein